MGKRLIIKGASFITNAIDRITPSTTYYSVTYNLTHCTASNNTTSIAAGSTYTVTITPQSGYTIQSVTVKHNGQTVMPTGSGYTYRINSVSGNISVTATAIADEPIVTTYTVTYNLSNVNSSNNATTVNAGSSYTVTLSPISGYEMQTVSVTHNGVTVTPTSGYTYNIPSVSGNIVINATAAQQQVTTYTVTYNLSNCSSNNNTTVVNEGATYSFTLTANSGYLMDSATVTHNGVAVSPTSDYNYTISNVSGNIVVTASAVEDVQPTTDIDITSNMVRAYYYYNSTKKTIIAGDAVGETGTNYNKYLIPTESGTPAAIPFSNGEYKIVIPVGFKYRLCMAKNDGTDRGNAASGDLWRATSEVTPTEEKVIYASEMPTLTGKDTTTYPYWGINIANSDGTTITVANAITAGLRVIKNPTITE